MNTELAPQSIASYPRAEAFPALRSISTAGAFAYQPLRPWNGWAPTIGELRSWLSSTSTAWPDADSPRPADGAIVAALALADMLVNLHAPPPTRLVSTCDGTVVFERAAGTGLEVIEAMPDGRLDVIVFDGPKLVSRYEMRAFRPA